MFGFVLVGRLVAQRLVKSLAIIKRFNVLEHAQPGVCQRLVLAMLRPFVLERPEESLGHGVVVAVTATTHRARNSQRPQLALIRVASLLANAIAMMQKLATQRPGQPGP
ncbi:hypothetical protein [Bremerella cremea]|uniref:hypothetical protein n=1 Tax=Bremerella cremea TaxID=1031537 RepID=UPI001F35478D|nr:hypothetical protein [Bremerella cremea]